ncbi:transposon Tf2-6 polyprotein [Trichonephila inaurata madagascariensis]|uniref:Transposon Tf2-6 polyprotein n=1 Tax=Trichonephila inaurata madagascariensis TaxID=2747483 RepID=A0A8X6MGB2_9ARAC|nr:transposon Tf2-6 polyprotein [Trichonephila inaurata madagascariensis]
MFHVREVLQRLDDYGLTINTSKCMFGCSEVPFVGYLVNKDCILPLPEKVELIANYKTTYHSSSDLGVALKWNAEAINAFNQRKNQLANVTLLAHPSQDADLAFMTNDSDFGLGASLNEITSDGLKPLGFFSKKIPPAQTKYSAFDHTSQALCVCDNVPVDAFSRISAIVTPSTIDYEEFAQMQQGDEESKALLSATNQTLQLKQLRMPGSTTEIYCDISTGTVRPIMCLIYSPTECFFLQCTTFRILEFKVLQS